VYFIFIRPLRTFLLFGTAAALLFALTFKPAPAGFHVLLLIDAGIAALIALNALHWVLRSFRIFFR
jgi:hypothetical protein